MSLLLASRRLRATVASLLLSTATSTFALDTATIVSSALSPDCLEYRVVGICYWLYCTPFGCSVRTSARCATTSPMRWCRATRTPAKTRGWKSGR